MGFKHTATALAVAFSASIAATGADAAQVAFGDYFIHDAQTDADGSGSHGLYLNGFMPGSSYDSKRWSISKGSASVAADGLSFEAHVSHSVSPSYGFKLSAALDPIATPASGTAGPECQGNACTHISDNDIRYYNKEDDQGTPTKFATLEGTGSIAGMLINLFVNDVNDEKPAQLGLGGSWFSGNTSLEGFATWLTWEVVDNGGHTDFASSGSGDINWLLGDSSTTTTVPLPAAGWLLIAGLGGLAAMRRRGDA